MAAAEQRENREAEERSSPSGKVIYKAILAEGEEELERPTPALFWSGFAAGLSMGFSMIAEGLLKTHLPEGDWNILVTKLGYCVGFLIVVLGRQQLFTENTLTPILPLLQRRRQASVANVLRLWGVVLVANLLGTLAVAFAVTHTDGFSAEALASFTQIGTKALQPTFGGNIIRGIFAGWLIALMVWVLPFAETARVWVIIILAYIVGLGEFSHVIAGAVEVFTVAAAGGAGWAEVVGGYLVPTLIGNVIGGVMMVTMINHAQVTAGGAAKDL
ncbi:MAG TPA: formate/nitrite transporter family protein [Usitatibacter sp.]|nr:formate/nitrite transporter family protein [Usitatibacter sp.]